MMITRKVFLMVMGVITCLSITKSYGQADTVQKLHAKIESHLNTVEGQALVKKCERAVQNSSQQPETVVIDQEFLKIMLMGILEGAVWPLVTKNQGRDNGNQDIIDGAGCLDALVTGAMVALSARAGSWPKLGLRDLLKTEDLIMIPSAYAATYIAMFATFYLLIGFHLVTGLGESLIPIKNETAERNFEIGIGIINKLILASIPLYKRYRLQSNMPRIPKTRVAVA